MKLSIKKLIKELQDLTAAHNQIKTFEYGDFLTIIKKNIDYTCVMANVSNATNRTSQNLINLSVDLFVCDKTLKGDENKVTVENNTLQILNDLLGVISYSPRWQDFGVVTTSTPYRKYYDRTADVVTGWSATITFEVIHKNGFCDVPIFDYDYDQSVDGGCVILVTVINTDDDVLTTKAVTEGDSSITVPNITFTDSDGTTSSQPAGIDLVCTPVSPATVENSDESYSTTVASGGTLVLPDITVTDSDGSTYTQPSVQDVTCTPQDNTITMDLSFIGTDDQSNIIFNAAGVTTYTTLVSDTNIGTLTISTDNVTFSAFSLPFTPIVATPYYFKRTGTGNGSYVITD